MTESTTLAASTRDVIGKTSKRLAHEGRIPAVLYGAGRQAASLSLDRHEFEMFQAHHAASAVISLEIDGESKPVNVMIKEVQRSPVKGVVLHVDLLAVRMDQVIATSVPMHLVGDAQGVRMGGVLTASVHEVHVEALPANLPEALEVDVTALDVNESMTLADVVVPDGVRILDDLETIVCSVTPPAAEEVEEVAEEAAEPVLIGEEPADGESGE